MVAAATAATAAVTAAAAASGTFSGPPAAGKIRAGDELGRYGSFSAASGLAGVPTADSRSGARAAASPASAHSPSSLHAAGAAHGSTVTVAAKAHTAPPTPVGHATPVQHAAPAKPKAPAQRAAPHRLTHPYRLYDSVTPSSIPARQAAAVYATGSYSANPSQIRGLGHTLWIDTVGTDYAASVLDVEPGDATPAKAANWVWHRLHAYPHAMARIYTMRSEWPAVEAAIATLPPWMRAHVHWWIADPTGVPHIVPGAQATQWYWGSGYDESLMQPGF